MNPVNDEALRRGVLWRIHGLAALLSTPFLLLAAVTGLIYVAAPQVEQARAGSLHQVPPAPWLPLDRLVAAAAAAAPPGLVLRQVLPPQRPGDALQAGFMPGDARHAGHHGADTHRAAPTADPSLAQGLTVFVDPGTAAVLGQQREAERFGPWARQLHSSLLQGEGLRWMIEWAATCLLVMLLSGLGLAWPRRGQLLPRRGLRGRAAWRQWHAFVGFVLGLMSLAIVLTGLTWSGYAGAQIRSLRDLVGQAPPAVPKTLMSDPADGAAPLSWQAVWLLARAQAPGLPLQLTPPRGPRGIWRVAGGERSQPTRRVEVVFDAYSGRRLYHAGWQDQTWFAKATALGIPFHRGEFGLWNQALLAVFGGALLFSIVTGWVMWWRRRRTGWLGLRALPAGAWRRVPWRAPALAATVALCVLLPLLTAFAGLLLLVEWQGRRTIGAVLPARN